MSESAAYPPNYPDSHDPTGPPSTEELLGKSSAAQGQDERTMTFGVEVGGEKIGEVTLPIAQAVALGFRPQVSDQWLLAVMRRV